MNHVSPSAFSVWPLKPSVVEPADGPPAVFTFPRIAMRSLAAKAVDVGLIVTKVLGTVVVCIAVLIEVVKTATEDTAPAVNLNIWKSTASAPALAPPQ